MSHRSVRPQDAPGKDTILAAGTLPFRGRGAELEVALVHRPRYDDWAWAKGKLDPGEHWAQAATRETAEETGLDVRLRLPLPSAHYEVPSPAGEPVEKVVRYWAARVVGGAGALHHEVDEVRWLRGAEAGALLTHAHDQAQLEALRRADADGLLAAWPLAIVRHAKAVPRKAWSDDDWLRPLNGLGTSQAEELIGVLGAFGIRRVVTSTATRCLDTVEPYARSLDVEPETTKWLSEEGFAGAPHWLPSVLAETLEAAEPALLCSHGPVLPDLLALLAERSANEGSAAALAKAAGDKLAKGETLVAHVLGRGGQARVVAVERHPPLR